MIGFAAKHRTAVIGTLVLALMLGPAFAEISYTVQPGDSLSKLALRFSVPLQQLIELNNISNPDVIYVGTTLKLPDGAVDSEATATVETPEASPRPLTGRELYEARAKALAEQQQAQGRQVVETARAFTGTRYRWGGLSSRGIDCSGLVVRAMAAQGIRVPHRAAEIYKLGTKVTYAELQPGDLVFFNTNGRGVSHVGIWVGENKFIHASSGSGRVQTDALAGYYAQRLVGARRIQK